MTISLTPRIYVGTYAKYNNGDLTGQWVDLEGFGSLDEFIDHCKTIHADESDPELMFQDYEGFPKELYSECSLEESLFEWLSLDNDDRELLARYVDACDGDWSIEDARDHFQGKYSSGADFAEQLCEDVGYIPKDLPSWIVIDWESTWECNLRHDYSVSRDESGDLWIFRD